MPLTLQGVVAPDPDGFRPGLRLKGDWVYVLVSDGTHTGFGEISHSGDDASCRHVARELFARHLSGLELTRASLARLEVGPFARAPDFITATAMSGLNQAFYDLLARRAGVPVWRLFADEPSQTTVPAYATLNRALTARGEADYLRVAAAARAAGFRAVKVAPFEAVRPGVAVPTAAAQSGLAILRALRRAFPELALRVDCHARFEPAVAVALAPEFDALGLVWVEEPCAIGPGLRAVRRALCTPLAAGELFFGAAEFRRILVGDWAGVIMPDVKHCGGFGPLAAIIRLAAAHNAEVSPHNPSGLVSTLASLHAAALSPCVTSLEVPFALETARVPCLDWLADGAFPLPTAAGWGLSVDELLARVGASAAAA